MGWRRRRKPAKLWVHQLQLTIADFVLEIHDTHHPLGPSLYYEDQRAPAKKRTEEFWKERVPKYLGYFEGLLEASGGTYVTGRRADLCRSLAVPDRGRTALRLSEAHGGVRAGAFRHWSTCATASRRGRTSRPISRASGASRSTRRGFSGGTRNWMFSAVIPGHRAAVNYGAQLRTRQSRDSPMAMAHRSSRYRAPRNDGVYPHMLRPSTGVIFSFDSSMPSMQLTFSAITSDPSGFLPRAKTSTPQSTQS